MDKEHVKVVLMEYELPKKITNRLRNIDKPADDPAYIESAIKESRTAIRSLLREIFSDADFTELAKALPTEKQIEKKEQIRELEIHQFAYWNISNKKLRDAIDRTKNRLGNVSKRTFRRTAKRVSDASGEEERERETDNYAIRGSQNILMNVVEGLGVEITDEVNRLIALAQTGTLSREDFKTEVKKIRKKGEARALMIAKTEMTRIAADATEKRLKEHGIRYWRWSAARETLATGQVGKAGKTCEICTELHGKVAPIGMPFAYIDGKAMVKPPDPHPNCRCAVTPVSTEEFRRLARR
jgi:SPP1 gp7 family putative phage head morphogenesis protein